MRIIDLPTASIGALVLALTLGVTAQPVEAGRACNELDLDSPCINSNDLRARLTLRESGRDGRLQIRDAANAAAFNVNGASGNVTNLFSSEEDESNGLVKAWARVNPDGSVEACWRCNTDPAETRRTGTGVYEVDFTPLATDIQGRPRSVILNGAGGSAVTADDLADPSSVFVGTIGLTDAFADGEFILLIY
jgi:hypothetical protein